MITGNYFVDAFVWLFIYLTGCMVSYVLFRKLWGRPKTPWDVLNEKRVVALSWLSVVISCFIFVAKFIVWIFSTVRRTLDRIFNL